MLSTSLLRGDKVRLTTCNPEDLPTVARWYEDARFARFLDAAPASPRSERNLGEWLNGYDKSSSGYLFGIRLLDAEELIGFIELNAILWPHGVCRLAIAIGEVAHRGKGYGHEALRLALQFAFHELNLHRVQLTVFAYNEHAIRLCEKLGFRREGTYREFMRRDGQRYDMYLYGLLRHEWEAGLLEA